MNGSLFLSPKNNAANCTLDALLSPLNALGVIGAEISRSPKSQLYMAGESFSRHIVFAGCSPYLKFQPEDDLDKNFCHIALHGVFETERLLTGKNTVKPRCPHCRGRIKDWQRHIQQPFACDNCNITTASNRLDWRQQAAAGRIFIEVRNVFPGEALPSDTLLSAMSTATQVEWNYAWAGMKLDI